jgi:hypothetical protein
MVDAKLREMKDNDLIGKFISQSYKDEGIAQ